MDCEATDSQFPVLLVDDDSRALDVCRKQLLLEGISPVYTISDSRSVMHFLEHHQVSVIILDLMMPHLPGEELLPRLREEYPQIPVVIITGACDVKTVVDCMKAGAADYLVKPVSMSHLLATIRGVLDLSSLRQEVDQLKDYLIHNHLSHPEMFSEIKTNSRKMRSLFQYAEVVAKSPLPVMITGETGAGKELFARAIHSLSGVKGEFVTVNVAGLDDTMFTDTLFGHKKGAFTGADQAREGLVGKASGGTLFLDEIGDLKELSQVKLLRLLQEREYYPVGSDTIKTSKARVILATNVDLEARISQGKFRRDLYYRLCTHMISIPPLRERSEDIPLLLGHFIEKACRQMKMSPPIPAPELLAALKAYPFPGNVREIHAMVYDAMTRHTGGPLTPEHFPGIAPSTVPPLVPPSALANGSDCVYTLFGRLPTFKEIEDYLIAEAMKISGGSQAIAATMLGVTRQTISNRLRQMQ